MVNAYKELEKNGFIFSKRGSGSYVAEQVINTIDELEENNRSHSAKLRVAEKL